MSGREFKKVGDYYLLGETLGRIMQKVVSLVDYDLLPLEYEITFKEGNDQMDLSLRKNLKNYLKSSGNKKLEKIAKIMEEEELFV